MSGSTESDIISLQRRVQHLEKKIKTWSRVFRQETLWKHNLEDWLIQNFDYNIRLQTELGFFKSSDEEDDKDDLGVGNATKALSKLASKRHLAAVPNLVRRGGGSGVQIISCQANATVFPARESNDELYIKKQRLNSYEDGHTIDIGSTTVSTVNSHSSSSGRYSQLRNSSPIINSSNQLNTNRITIEEIENKNATNNFSVSNSTVVENIVDPTNTIILNANNSSYEYETEESYTPRPCPRARRKTSRDELLSSQEDNATSTSVRQFTNNTSRASASDTAASSDVLIVSDDSDSSSVVFLDNYAVDSANKPPVNFTHQCTSCGRRIANEGPTFSHFLKMEETTCFICQMEQLNQHQADTPDKIFIEAAFRNTPQCGIIEILANSGVEMDAKIVKKALVKCDHWSEFARLLIRNYFPREVLLRSNAKGGERKVPGGDGSRHVPLDENVIYIIKNFVKEFWQSKGGTPVEVDKGFNRVVNKVCQRERDKVKRKQNMEDVNTSFFHQLDSNLQQNN